MSKRVRKDIPGELWDTASRYKVLVGSELNSVLKLSVISLVLAAVGNQVLLICVFPMPIFKSATLCMISLLQELKYIKYCTSSPAVFRMMQFERHIDQRPQI